jgi:hypothetical protein
MTLRFDENIRGYRPATAEIPLGTFVRQELTGGAPVASAEPVAHGKRTLLFPWPLAVVGFAGLLTLAWAGILVWCLISLIESMI